MKKKVGTKRNEQRCGVCRKVGHNARRHQQHKINNTTSVQKKDLTQKPTRNHRVKHATISTKNTTAKASSGTQKSPTKENVPTWEKGDHTTLVALWDAMIPNLEKSLPPWIAPSGYPANATQVADILTLFAKKVSTVTQVPTHIWKQFFVHQKTPLTILLLSINGGGSSTPPSFIQAIHEIYEETHTKGEIAPQLADMFTAEFALNTHAQNFPTTQKSSPLTESIRELVNTN